MPRYDYKSPNLIENMLRQQRSMVMQIKQLANHKRPTLPFWESGQEPPDLVDNQIWIADDFSVNVRISGTTYKLGARLEDIRLVGAAAQPVFQNGWVNYEGGFAQAGFYKDVYNNVYLQGVIKSGTIPSTVFILPTGYIPPTSRIFTVSANTAFGEVRIGTDGSVVVQSGNNAFVSLDGITFRL